MDEFVWMLAVGGIVAFICSFGIGANDVANSFATSVGAKTLTLRQACIVAAIFEFSGAFLMGAHVTSTIRKGIIDASVFEDRPDILMLVMFSALISTAAWLLIATKLELPVSTTHTIVGGVIGAGMVYAGSAAVQWKMVLFILVSWFVSPTLAGLIAVTLFLITRHFILRHEQSLARGYRVYPLLVGITLACNIFFIVFKGSPGLMLDRLPFWAAVLLTLSISTLCGFLTQYFLIPIIRRRLDRLEQEAPSSIVSQEMQHINPVDQAMPEEVLREFRVDVPQEVTASEAGGTSIEKGLNVITQHVKTDLVADTIAKDDAIADLHATSECFDQKTENLFSYLQMLTAVFDSFAHGSNDVANSIGPFAAMYGIYESGSIQGTEGMHSWILALGGIGIVLGLSTWGYRIIGAIGVRLTKITPSRGFAIELGASLVVVSASRIGIPVSTTHCLVGSTAAVGMTDGIKSVNWSMMLRTYVGWVATLFIAAISSATIFSALAFSPSLL